MASIVEYKGNKTLLLNPDEEYKVYFGREKCKKIMDSFYSIRMHVISYQGLAGKKPSITICEGTQYPIELSYYKCEKIVEYQVEIRQFAEEGKILC
ncbi:MAG: hypothetical protein IT280_04875 [Ignavibacteria bacterium]|nr:hypothetical protein [Ignavibacteria bacterium]